MESKSECCPIGGGVTQLRWTRCGDSNAGLVEEIGVELKKIAGINGMAWAFRGEPTRQFIKYWDT